MRKRKALKPETLELFQELYREGCEIHCAINWDGKWCWRVEGLIDYQDSNGPGWESFEGRTLEAAAKQFRRYQQKVLEEARA